VGEQMLGRQTVPLLAPPDLGDVVGPTQKRLS
jgi:hypothetical protein